MVDQSIQTAIYDGWNITLRREQTASASGLPYGAVEVTVNAVHESSIKNADPCLLVLSFHTFDRPNQQPLEKRIAAYLEPVLKAINSEMLPF